MIGYYSTSMHASSADGIRLGGSAYGHSLFSPIRGGKSQFDQVVKLLLNEADSKRGYLPVFEAKELADLDNPDVACLAGLHLLLRDGRLHMVCNMRANDLDCGLLSDVFSFTMIHEYAAIQLGLELGTYTHTIGSAHVNDSDAERVERVLAEADSRSAPPSFPFPEMPRDTDGSTIADVLHHEHVLRTNYRRYTAERIAGLDLDPYWQQAVLLFELYRQIQHDQTTAFDPDVLAALDPGLRWLMERKWPVCAATSGGGSE